MTLKQARAEVRSQIKDEHRFKYINFTKEFTYYLSDYPLTQTVYRCYGDGRLTVVDSDYAKRFLIKKKEYELRRSKHNKVKT